MDEELRLNVLDFLTRVQRFINAPWGHSHPTAADREAHSLRDECKDLRKRIETPTLIDMRRLP